MPLILPALPRIRLYDKITSRLYGQHLPLAHGTGNSASAREAQRT